MIVFEHMTELLDSGAPCWQKLAQKVQIAAAGMQGLAGAVIESLV